ncbi:WD40 repeat domain-containing protein, partial [Geodermatophilus maliterrae]
TRLGAPLTGHTGPVWAMALDPAGQVLATAGEEGTVLLWNVTDPARPTRLGAPLTGHTGAVTTVAFDPDGQVLATAGVAGTVLLWDLADPAQPTPLEAPLTHRDEATAVAFFPGEHILVTAGTDDTVRLWDLSGLDAFRDQPLERACSITGGGLDRAEWTGYILGFEYVNVCRP